MKTTMSSRERMLLAINHQEADHVPLTFRLFGDWTPPHDDWDREFDHMAVIGAPSRYHPDVKTRTWREKKPGERYPILFKEYETPKGIIKQIVQETEDWPHGDDVPLLSDHMDSRAKKFAVEDLEDLEKIPYLFYDPTDEQIRDFKEHGMTTVDVSSPFYFQWNRDGTPRMEHFKGMINAASQVGFNDPLYWYFAHYLHAAKAFHPGNVLNYDAKVHPRRAAGRVSGVGSCCC